MSCWSNDLSIKCFVDQYDCRSIVKEVRTNFVDSKKKVNLWLPRQTQRKKTFSVKILKHKQKCSSKCKPKNYMRNLYLTLIILSSFLINKCVCDVIYWRPPYNFPSAQHKIVHFLFFCVCPWNHSNVTYF